MAASPVYELAASAILYVHWVLCVSEKKRSKQVTWQQVTAPGGGIEQGEGETRGSGGVRTEAHWMPTTTFLPASRHQLQRGTSSSAE
jgi:hypothetical protein